MAKKPKRIKLAAGNGGRKMRLPPRSKGAGSGAKKQARDEIGRFA